jgi:hypothetical protein
MSQEDWDKIIDWLQEHGHTPREVDIIVQRLKQHDELMKLDSIYNSIAEGSIDLAALIDDALQDDDG